MKKVIFVYGPIAGIIMGLLLSTFTAFLCDPANMNTGMVIGYTTMLLSLTLVFFGIRSYRDHFSNGTVTFGRAFGVGILISLVACIFYSLVWLVFQHFFIPDFYDVYANHHLEAVKASGATAQEITKAQKDVDFMHTVGGSPVMIFFFSLLEPLPVALIVTPISALILKKKATPSVQ